MFVSFSGVRVEKRETTLFRYNANNYFLCVITDFRFNTGDTFFLTADVSYSRQSNGHNETTEGVFSYRRVGEI